MGVTEVFIIVIGGVVIVSIIMASNGYFRNYSNYRKLDRKTLPFHSKLYKNRPDTFDNIVAICLDKGTRKRMLCQQATIPVEQMDVFISYMWWNYYGTVIADYKPIEEFLRANFQKHGKSHYVRVMVPLVHVKVLSKDCYLREWYYKPKYKCYFRRLPIFQIHYDPLSKDLNQSQHIITAPLLQQIKAKVEELSVVGGPSINYRHQAECLRLYVNDILCKIEGEIKEIHQSKTQKEMLQANLEKEIEALKLRLSEKEEELHLSKKKMVMLNEEKDKYEERLHKYEERLHEDEYRLHKKERELYEVIRESELLKKELNEIKSQYEKSTNSANIDELQHLHLQVKSLHEDKCTLQKEKSSLQAKVCDLESQVVDLHNRRKKLECVIEESDTKIKNLQEEFKRDINHLKCKLSEKEKQYHTVQEEFELSIRDFNKCFSIVPKSYRIVASQCVSFFTLMSQLQKEAINLTRYVSDTKFEDSDKDIFNYYYISITNKFYRAIDETLMHDFRLELSDLAETGYLRNDGQIWKFISAQKDVNPSNVCKFLYQQLFHNLCGAVITYADDLASLSVFCPTLSIDSKPFEQLSEKLLDATHQMGYSPVYVKLFTPYTEYLNISVEKSVKMDNFNKDVIMEVLHMGINYQGTTDKTRVSINT